MSDEFMPRWNVSQAGDLYIGLEVETEHPFGSLITPVWDHYAHHVALEDAGFRPVEILRVREAFLKSYYLKGRFGEDAEMPQNISIIMWSHDTIAEKAKEMMRVLVEYIPNIGADDGFFDYFPNAYSMVEQMFFNVKESNLLNEDEEDDLLNHMSMTRQVAFVMRYHPREYWDLIGASGREYEILQQWLRRGWVIENSIPVAEDFYHKYKFTERFWDAMQLDPVKELTA